MQVSTQLAHTGQIWLGLGRSSCTIYNPHNPAPTVTRKGVIVFHSQPQVVQEVASVSRNTSSVTPSSFNEPYWLFDNAKHNNQRPLLSTAIVVRLFCSNPVRVHLKSSLLGDQCVHEPSTTTSEVGASQAQVHQSHALCQPLRY